MSAGLRLRPHVRVEPRANGARIHDDLLVNAFDIGPIGTALVSRLDGTRTVAELITCDEDATILRRFFLLNLVEGAGDGIAAKVARVLSGAEQLEYSILEGARFQCQGSGECCQNYVFGPLEDEDIAALEALPIGDAFPHLRGAQLVEDFDVGGFKMRYLKSVDDRCVFLEGDRRCGLHARFGPESKPKLCRLYPIEYLATLDGMRLFDKGSCASFAVSARSGPTLVEDLPRIKTLLPSGKVNLHHPTVIVDEYPCDFGHFDRFAKAAMAVVKADRGTATETLRAIGRGTRAFAHVLRSFPLEPGQPDAAIADFLAGDAARWYQGEPGAETVHSGAVYYSEIFTALLIGASNAIGNEASKSRFLSLRLVREAAQLFHLAAAATSLAVDPTIEVGDYVRGVLAVEVRDPEIDGLLRISMRQQLFGNGSLVNGHFLPALVRMALVQIMTITGARLRAHGEGRSAVLAGDLSWGHMLALRDLAGGDRTPALLAAEDKFTDLLEALPAVLRLDYRRPMP